MIYLEAVTSQPCCVPTREAPLRKGIQLVVQDDTSMSCPLATTNTKAREQIHRPRFFKMLASEIQIRSSMASCLDISNGDQFRLSVAASENPIIFNKLETKRTTFVLLMPWQRTCTLTVFLTLKIFSISQSGQKDVSATSRAQSRSRS